MKAPKHNLHPHALKVKSKHDGGVQTTKTLDNSGNKNSNNNSKDIQGVAMDGPASQPAQVCVM